MTGPTTAGYAGLAAGEPWHYVGDATTGLGTVLLSDFTGTVAFRLRAPDFVDIVGEIVWPGTSPFSDVVQLPEGYRPVASQQLGIVRRSSGGTDSARLLDVTSAGFVTVDQVATDDTVFINVSASLSVASV